MEKRRLFLITVIVLILSMITSPVMAMQSYTVQYGDTLWKIGQKLGVDYLEIAEKNNLENINTIYPGDVLIIEEDEVLDEEDEVIEKALPLTEDEEEYTFEITDDDMDLSERYSEGYNGAVSSANPVAAKIGIEILKNGGNAIDAAVAMSFAMSLLEPHASGVGGGGFAMLHIENEDKQVFVDYANAAPKALTREVYRRLSSDEDRNSGIAAIVPGAVAGWLKIHEMYGQLELSEILKPVIYIAENGFVITPTLYISLYDGYGTLTLNEETMRVFTDSGLPYFEGQTFKNPDYAELMKKIVAEGKDGFYKGEIAENIVSSLKAEGGIMTMEDLANYEAKIKEPVSTTYRGYTVMSSPPASRGGACIIQSLNMAENYDIASMGYNTSETLNLWAEIFKLSTIDSYTYLGDTDNYKSYTNALSSKEYAKKRTSYINLEEPMLRAEKGYPDEESASTTHLVVADKYGNAVSMTNTLGHYFGCGITVKDYGFLLNDHTFNYSATLWKVNYPEEGKRARSTMSPVLIFDEEGDFMCAIGTPGGARIISMNTLMVSNIIDFNLGIQETIDAPRIYQSYYGPIEVEKSLDETVIEELKEIGHNIVEYDNFGGAQGIIYDKRSKLFKAGADERRDGKSFAY